MLSGAATPGQPVTPGVAGWPPGPSFAGPGLARRLVAAAYRSEQEAPDKVLRLGSAVNVFLFACPVPLEYARRAGVLRAPATSVPLSGSALFAALLRARADGRHDLSRVSVDVLSRGDVEDAFAELDIPTGDIHVREDPGGRRHPGRVPRAALAPRPDLGRVHLPGVGGPAPHRRRDPRLRRAPHRQRDPVGRCGPRPCSARSAGWRRRSSRSWWWRCRPSARQRGAPLPGNRRRNCASPSTGSCCRKPSGCRRRSARWGITRSWSQRPAGRCRGRPTASGCRRSPSAPAASWASRSRWVSAWAGRPRTRRRTRGPPWPAPTPTPGAPGLCPRPRRATRWSRRRARLPWPRRAGRRAWRPCPGSPTSSPRRRRARGQRGDRRPAARRHVPNRPPAASYPGRRGPGLAAAAEPDPPAGAPAAVLPPRHREAGARPLTRGQHRAAEAAPADARPAPRRP